MRRVAVNLLWCRPGLVGGSEDYLVRQLLGLGELTHDVALTVFALPSFAPAHPELLDMYRIVEAPVDGASRPRRVWAEHTWLAEQTRGSSLVHHGGGTVPMRGAQPTLLTIHDLQYLTHPEYLHPVKRLYLSRALPRSAARATAIAVPTEYVRGTVTDAYGVDPAGVVVVPHGMERTLGAAATAEDELRAKYALGGGPVVVLPAMTHPHKGHVFLLEVMARYWPDADLRLVLTGGAGAAEDEVVASIARLGLGGRVVRTGRVPVTDRDGLLRMATAMVFPSEYEGFGAPIIEAMTLGCPVVCSDRTCLPEVAGGAAIVLPLQTDAWADALQHVTRDRAELVHAGRRRAAAFTARRSAEALLDAYDLAAR